MNKEAYNLGDMEKEAGSKLRELLRAGKLSWKQIANLRKIGMLPQAQTFIQGLERGNKSIAQRLGVKYLQLKSRDPFTTGWRRFNSPPPGDIPIGAIQKIKGLKGISLNPKYMLQSLRMLGIKSPIATLSQDKFLEQFSRHGKHAIKRSVASGGQRALAGRHELDELRAALRGSKFKPKTTQLRRQRKLIPMASHRDIGVLREELRNVQALDPPTQDVIARMRSIRNQKPPKGWFDISEHELAKQLSAPPQREELNTLIKNLYNNYRAI